MRTWGTSAAARYASRGLPCVLPGLTLNYFGQGALLIANPQAVENPFYLMFPNWALLPMVVLATAATVIASQAVISGTYSMTKQAIQLGFLPRMQIVQTSAREIGQIYIPGINWALLIAIIAAVIGFGSSSNLASAYGLAVSGTMLITTLLTFFVVRFSWHYSLTLCVLSTSFFLVVDAAFFSANLFKFIEGGWFPLAMGAVIFTRHGHVAARPRGTLPAFAQVLAAAGAVSQDVVSGSAASRARHGDISDRGSRTRCRMRCCTILRTTRSYTSG